MPPFISKLVTVIAKALFNGYGEQLRVRESDSRCGGLGGGLYLSRCSFLVEGVVVEPGYPSFGAVKGHGSTLSYVAQFQWRYGKGLVLSCSCLLNGT